MDTKQRMFQKFLYNGSYKTDNGFFFYLYYTGKKTLAFVYRNKGNYDGLEYRFQEFTANVPLSPRKILLKRKTHLPG